MASYYEVLGVDPEASHDEVKRAYLALALRYHPDRQDTDEPDALEMASWRMREVNEAWSVLQSPAHRAAYDRDLLAARAGGGVHEGTGRSWGQAGGGRSWVGTVDPDLPLPEPESDGPARPVGAAPRFSPPPRRGHSSPLRPFLPLIVLGVLLFIVIVFTAYAKPQPDRELDVQTTDEFGTGTCVVVYTDATAEAVACDGPSTGRVVSTVRFPLPCPPDTVQALLRTGNALCLAETP